MSIIDKPPKIVVAIGIVLMMVGVTAFWLFMAFLVGPPPPRLVGLILLAGLCVCATMVHRMWKSKD